MAKDGFGIQYDDVRWSEESVTVNGVDVPARVWMTIRHYAWPAAAELYVETDPVHGPVARGITVTGDGDSPVSYRDVDQALSKDFDLAEVISIGLGHASFARTIRRLEPGRQDLEGLPRDVAAAAVNAMQAVRAQVKPKRRRTLTRELLADVADTYRTALADGEPPTQAVANRFSVSHRTATRWVAEARAAGELGAAIGPVAGEARALE
jgi:hypothetical protein